MPYLYLVRHAQPDFVGHYDSVTDLGLQQSAWLGEHFAARGLRFARVISGSLERQRHTLDAILGCLPGARLIKGSIRYFHKQSSLDAHYYLVDENALLLDEGTEAAPLNRATKCEPQASGGANGSGFQGWHVSPQTCA